MSLSVWAVYGEQITIFYMAFFSDTNRMILESFEDDHNKDVVVGVTNTVDPIG